MTDRKKALDDLMAEDADLIGADPDIEAAAPERIAVNLDWEDGCCPVEDVTNGLDDDVGKFFSRDHAVEYIRADLAKPRVKRLVWSDDLHGEYGFSVSYTYVGRYCVAKTLMNPMWSVRREDDKFADDIKTLQEAKAAAQADFERRVMECLE